MQPKRGRLAAMRFFRKLLRTTRRKPRVITTDKLRSYGAAKKVVLPRVIHRPSRYLNNRAENSHQPTRQRERRMKKFKSRNRHNASWKYTTSWHLLSDPSVICFRRLIIERSESNNFKFGMTSWQHKGDESMNVAFTSR